MTRLWLWLMLSELCAMGCGPDRARCPGAQADFNVTLRLRDRPLPPDTVVHVTYGGSGMEDYSLQEQNVTHEVVFCHSGNPDCSDADAGMVAAAGAAGAAGTGDGVEALCCAFWTGGSAKLQVRATGLATMTYDLAPREHSCTVTQTIVLDSPDGG